MSKTCRNVKLESYHDDYIAQRYKFGQPQRPPALYTTAGHDDVLAALRDKGIEIAKRGHADVAEEAGHAYKDVDQVMEDSRDLVEPVYRLRPLGVVKG